MRPFRAVRVRVAIELCHRRAPRATPVWTNRGFRHRPPERRAASLLTLRRALHWPAASSGGRVCVMPKFQPVAPPTTEMSIAVRLPTTVGRAGGWCRPVPVGNLAAYREPPRAPPGQRGEQQEPGKLCERGPLVAGYVQTHRDSSACQRHRAVVFAISDVNLPRSTATASGVSRRCGSYRSTPPSKPTAPRVISKNLGRTN